MNMSLQSLIKEQKPIKSIYENNKSYIDFSFKNQENNLEIKYER